MRKRKKKEERKGRRYSGGSNPQGHDRVKLALTFYSIENFESSSTTLTSQPNLFKFSF